MNSVLQPFLRQFVTVFFYDILIFSDSLPGHIKHLNAVLNSLLQSKFYLKRSNCYFPERHLEYLGHVIFGDGTAPEQSKIVAMVTWSTPTSAKDIQAFLGVTSFYQRFIKSYASLATPFTALLCHDQFKLSPESQLAFDALKSAMTQAPVLIPPDFSQAFEIEIDASGTAIGIVLMQQDRPIAFLSKQFTPKLQRASTYIRELHSVTTAARKWRLYLLGHKFTIFTDHRSLKELMNQII